MKINSEQEMLEAGTQILSRVASLAPVATGLARSSSRCRAPEVPQKDIEYQQATVIELIGDVGVGKTTLVRGFAKGLGIKEPITSPSFTISKAYACPDGRTLIHYDFYRLNDPGLMAEDLEENLKNPNNIVIIEWSDSVKDILPKNHTIINIKYNDDGSRELEVK
ncbi:MAG: tRNA (adenosine(37)-N6)-threonylcarbamoyltransferase complex ATPase subunit type 1 TsaE [Candidatus Saccharibacteria bacterium]|nr:tRNA (adenosine(37)-N6)-threonylcarbamoyltransferase complex ATPase subunit type 1 TsaE [Candidatus Saccharibacteria bacterium]